MKMTWVLVANGSIAYIYQVEGKSDFTLLQQFSHAKSRQSGMDLKSDRSGRVKDSFGTGRHAMEETTDPKEVELQRFATEIANYLDDGRKHNLVERIYLAASPHFLGLVQKNLSSHVGSLVEETISKDLTYVPASELGQKINIRTLG